MGKLVKAAGDEARAEATEVAVMEDKGTAITEFEGGNEFFEQFAGRGMETVTQADILIPRYTVLQALSPQVNEAKAEFIEGAKQGMICDVGTGRLIGESFLFVPVQFLKVWLEWHPRKSGLGLANIHTDGRILNSTVKNEKKQDVLENGNTIQETSQLFGFHVEEDGSFRQMFIPFASTQQKKSKKILTAVTQLVILRDSSPTADPEGPRFNPPMFYSSFVLSTVAESNAEGDWFGWKVEAGPFVKDMPGYVARGIIRAAIKMYQQIDAGAIKADMSADDAMDAMSARSTAASQEGERM